MSHFRPVDRQTLYLFPPSMNDWLPENHLARFIVEIVDGLDLKPLEKVYGDRGKAAYHPGMLLSLLIYAYATGVFSSRKIERMTYDSVAFRFIAAESHPDHDTLATFRRRFLPQFSGLFVQVLELAQEMKLLKLGTVSLDGTKLHANASRHSALSYGHIKKQQVRLEAEVQQLLQLAEQADASLIPDGLELPQELAHRQARQHALQQAKQKIEARAKERDEREQAQYAAKRSAREQVRKQTGKKPGGKDPKPPEPGAKERDQINLTDEESRIMLQSGGGFDQSYNAQAAVDTASLLVVAAAITQAPNDKEQVKPMLAQIKALPSALGEAEILLADSGYFSADNVQACQEQGIEAFIAPGRQAHHSGWKERFTEPDALPDHASPTQRMAHKLRTLAGHATYALRKQTVEPVFGIIKSVMGFRQFSLRGLDKVSGEWALVCLAFNLKRMAVMRLQ